MVYTVTVAASSPLSQRNIYPRTYRTDRLALKRFFLSVFGVAGSVQLTSIFLMMSLYLQRTIVSGLSCEPCDVSDCKNATLCPGGLVLGPCGCCYECARQLNQSCGGMYHLSGICDQNLHCVIPVISGVLTESGAEGVCKEIPELGCYGQDCPPAYTQHLCPPDSFVAFKNRRPEDAAVGDRNSHHLKDLPSQELSAPKFKKVAKSDINNIDHVPEDSTYFCVCNISLCHIPACVRGFSLRLLQNATGLPGTCCDVYECQRSNDCTSTMCPPIEEELCPDDSVRLMPMWTDDHCCELQQGCSCSPEVKCQDIECPIGYQIDIISEATGLPGFCCTNFTCIPEKNLNCVFDGTEMRNGDSWQVDECKTCVCTYGLNKCTRKSCVGQGCSYMVIPKGECCPVCQGCLSDSGHVYNISEQWKENDCTTCTCNNGRTECQSEMCAVECLNPKRVPGRCCPVCEETCNLSCPFGFKSDDAGKVLCECSKDKCSAFKNCDKVCDYGYKKNKDGCMKCKCNKCPQVNCIKRCLHGYVLNDEGCPICKCKESYNPDLIDSQFQPGDGRACFSQEGSKHINGESWNDGCRKCYCHNGLEMCSLLACPSPQCSNPIFRVGDCCPTCPGFTVPDLEGKKEKCQTPEGHYYTEGETWKMDACTLCVCHGGNILCQTHTCPPVVCHHPVKPDGQCCAICRGDEGSTLAVTGHQHCRSSSGSTMYKHGEIWQSTPCQSCTCLDGQILCYNQLCPSVHCNKTVLRKGQCCPTCVGPSKDRVCIHNNVTYESGEKWLGDNCSQCWCFDGKKECFPIACPNLECNLGVIQKAGHCCQECYENTDSHMNLLVQRNFNASVTDKEKSTFDATAFGFSMLAIAIIAIIAVIVLVKMLYEKSKKYNSRPREISVENQETLIQSEKGKYWQKFTTSNNPIAAKAKRNSNDYAEMVFSDFLKGNYKSSITS